LNTDELRPEVEYEVIPLTVVERLEDTNPQLDRLIRDGDLRDRSLLIGREHSTILVAYSDN
jgi:hypothetical protein